MDQRLIFVAMMLFIVPFAAALGKNLFPFKKDQFNFIEVNFFGGGDTLTVRKDRKRAIQLLQKVSNSEREKISLFLIKYH